MSIVIHHNPDCGTSRNTLAIIAATGAEHTIIPYQETGWTCPQLLGLFAAADLTPRDALRVSKSPEKAFGLLEPGITNDAMIEAMIAPSDPREPSFCVYVQEGEAVPAVRGDVRFSGDAAARAVCQGRWADAD